MDRIEENTKHRITASSVIYIKNTILWMRLFAGVGILLGLIASFLYIISLNIQESYTVWSLFNTILVFFLLITYFVAIAYLLQAAQNFSSFVHYSIQANLEKAFIKQRYFWTLFGILLSVLFLLYAISLFQSTGFETVVPDETLLKPPN